MDLRGFLINNVFVLLVVEISERKACFSRGDCFTEGGKNFLVKIIERVKETL